MCTGGRVVNYLKALLGDACNDVLFVGYQAAGTPGRDILAYGPKGGWIELDGRRYDIRAQVHQLSGYSAHAGQADLVSFVEGITRHRRKSAWYTAMPRPNPGCVRCSKPGLGPGW